ncbi:MAG: hypothetical protein ABEJ46_00730, partial [Gemmatimonadota bacterium]
QAADTAAAETPLDTLAELTRTQGYAPLIRAALILVLGIPAVLALSRGIRRWITSVDSQQRGMIAGKLTFYAGGAV